MSEELKYAEQWKLSSKYFYEKKYYSWMSETIADYDIILEIGCGTGYSTLALAEQGHKVIAVDKNYDCIRIARTLIDDNGYTDKVVFLNGDVADCIFREKLINCYDFNAIICWNVGTYWNQEMMYYYLPYLLEYGLNQYQISVDPESSYAEFIIWMTCKMASKKGVPVQIVDRGGEIINSENDHYYHMLKKEFSFSSIKYDNIIANSISAGGRILSTHGDVHRDEKITIVFISVLMK